ncbi:MAG: hypothetical protein GXP62_11530, partial [Oligoflexia bacterium]|nr:hypothetical protein [Oligoflexia bacterium]
RDGSPVRLLAMWWLAERSALGTNAIARIVGCTPPVVSRALNRVRGSSTAQWVAWRGALLKRAN